MLKQKKVELNIHYIKEMVYSTTVYNFLSTSIAHEHDIVSNSDVTLKYNIQINELANITSRSYFNYNQFYACYESFHVISMKILDHAMNV